MRAAREAWRRLRRLAPRRRPVRLALAAVLAAFLALVATAAFRARLDAPPPTLLLLDRDGRFLGELPAEEGGELGYWRLGQLPARLVAATLSIEDHRFFHHPGVDPLAVARAFVQNVASGRRVSGASTLAMQVARMQAPGRRTYLRKAVETLTAVFLTARYGRQEVLRHYLTVVPYGNRIHGIAYAARRYLDKPVADLSWAEIAFLAAIPQSPARMNPFDPLGRQRAIARGDEILDRLRAEGTLPEVDYAVARRELARIRVPPRRHRPDEALHAVLRFAERLSEPAARRPLEADPLVHTTLDLAIQDEVFLRTLRAVDRWQAQGAGNAAVLVVDRRSFRVVAAVSSVGYFDRRRAGAIDYLRVPRSSGSTLKPFLYALALDRGRLTPTTILDDLEPGAGGITDADGRFLGPLLPRVALANSRNVPAANLLASLGVDRAYAFLGDLGLHRGREPARRYGLGLALGGLPVTLEDLVTAYTALAGDGRLHPLAWYRRQPAAAPRRVLSEDAARLVTLFLSDPQARLPSFPRMGQSEYPFAVAVKTGTSSQFRDAWCVAYSRRYLVGAWVGHPDARPMTGLSGYRSAGELVHEVLSWLERDRAEGLEDLAFPPPRGWHAERICALSGKRATSACDPVFLEWLPPGGEVLGECPFHRHLAVDRRDGLPATAATPRREIAVRTFLDLPPRYTAWAAAEGLPLLPRERSRGPRPPGAPAGGFAFAGGPVRVEVTSPEDGLRVLIDPETPPGRSTLALRAVVDPPRPQVVWYVDGRPFATVDAPYAVRWPLVPGEHRFRAEVPWTDARSRAVVVTVE